MLKKIVALLLLTGSTFIAGATPFSVSGFLVTNPTATLWVPNADLNEMQWNVWDSATLTNGAVASWTTTSASALAVTVSQGTPANRPVMSTAALGGIGAVGFAGAQSLTVPLISDPWRFYRAVILVLQANVTGATSSSGSFVAVAGSSGSVTNRQPYIGYTKSPNQIVVQWGVGTNSCSTTMAWPDDTNPHVVVARRYQGNVYMSVDSSAEVSSGSGTCGMQRQGNTGIIGDFRSPAVSFSLNYLSFLQNEMTADTAQRAAAYFMWKIGKQASIPGGNPWAASAPTSAPFVNPYLFNTFAEVDSVLNPCFHTNINSCLKATYATSMASRIANAPTLIWSQTFTNINMVCSEAAAASAPCVLFGPTLDGGCGNGTPVPVCVDPAVNTPTVFTQTGSELDINMQQIGGTGPWYTGTLSSVNINGQGFTVDPRTGPVYIVSRVKLTSPNSHCMWSSPLWTEPGFRFFNGTTPYGELDNPETYAGENSGRNYHLTQFQHDPPIHYPGRAVLSSQNGQDFATDLAHGWVADASSYDGSFHDYQMYIDNTETCSGLDGTILGCYPTLAFMKNPQELNVSLYANPVSDSPCTGTYILALNSLKVYQGTY